MNKEKGNYSHHFGVKRLTHTFCTGCAFVLSTVPSLPTYAAAKHAAQAQAVTQERTIDGGVTDEAGEPVIGASIIVKGTGMGTVTDVNGHFRLKVDEKTTLVISYLSPLKKVD